MSDAQSNAAPQAAAEILESIQPQQAEVSKDLAEASEAPKEVAELAAKEASGEKLTKKEENKLKEYSLKVNGKDKSFKIDTSNDEEMKKYFQKALASDESFQQAAEVRKAAMQFIDELRKNPRKVLNDPNIGVDLKKLAEEIMNEQLQDMEKTPEQREREKLQKELEEMKRQRDDEKKQWEEKEFERLQAQHEQQLETDISAALDIGGLPKTARTVKAMAEMMMIALENGIELTPKEIVPIIKNNTLSEFKEVVNSLGDDQLEDFLGKEVIARLRKKNVSKAKAIETASAIKSTGNEVKKAQEPKEKGKQQTVRDWLRSV